MTARDVMTTAVRTLAPDCPVGEALRRFAETGLQAFPVVDGTGRLLGTVSAVTILQRALPPYVASGELRHVGFAPDLAEVRRRLSALRAQPVSAVLDPDPPTVGPETPLLECGALMLHRAKTSFVLPVVEEGDRLVGLIAPWDLVKGVAEGGAGA
jgi:CBS domain-containing protein